MKQLLIIIMLPSIWSFSNNACGNLNSSSSEKQSDTLYLGYQYMEKMITEYQPIPFSKANKYMSRAHNLLTNDHINFDTISYKNIYESNTLFLDNETWGKFVFFENKTKQWYNSVQLYLLDKRGEIKDVIEIIATCDDAGRKIACYSFLIKEKGISTIYTRIDESTLTSEYLDGKRRDLDYFRDTIVAHQFKNGRKYPIKISIERQNELTDLFNENTLN